MGAFSNTVIGTCFFLSTFHFPHEHIVWVQGPPNVKYAWRILIGQEVVLVGQLMTLEKRKLFEPRVWQARESGVDPIDLRVDR